MKWMCGTILVGSVCLSGCGSSGSPGAGAQSVLTKGLKLPPGTNAVVAVQSTAGAKSATAKSFFPAAQATPGVTLDTAMIVLDEIELDLMTEGAGDDDNEVELEGPFLVDLVGETVQNLGESNLDDDADDDGVDDLHDDDDDGDGKSDVEDPDDDNDGVPDEEDQTVGETRLFDALELPPGTYGRMRFKAEPLEADDAPEPNHPMVGLTVLASGSVNGVPFEYCGRFEATFELESSTGIAVDQNAVATFLVAMDPLGWFADVDPFAGTLSDDGVLRICDGSNDALGDAIRAAIASHARLGRDEDGDGEDDDADLHEEDHDEPADASANDEANDEPSDASTAG